MLKFMRTPLPVPVSPCPSIASVPILAGCRLPAPLGHTQSKDDSQAVVFIIAAICKAHAITVERFMSRDRKEETFLPRWLAIHCAQKFTRLSPHAMAAAFNKDRCTIRFALTRLAERRTVDPNFDKEVRAWEAFFEKETIKIEIPNLK